MLLQAKVVWNSRSKWAGRCAAKFGRSVEPLRPDRTYTPGRLFRWAYHETTFQRKSGNPLSRCSCIKSCPIQVAENTQHRKRYRQFCCLCGFAGQIFFCQVGILSCDLSWWTRFEVWFGVGFLWMERSSFLQVQIGFAKGDVRHNIEASAFFPSLHLSFLLAADGHKLTVCGIVCDSWCIWHK